MPNLPAVPSMWYAHGLYNTIVFLLFVWQGWLGSKIKMERIAGGPPPLALIKKHRKSGAVITPLGIAGYLSGAAVVYFRGGHIFDRLFHFVAGSVLTLLIIATFLISRRIRGQEARFRTLHVAVGTATICAYILQIYTGIRILF